MQAFDTDNNIRRSCRLASMLLIISGLISLCSSAPVTTTKQNHAEIIRHAIAEDKLSFKLTTPDEFKLQIGPAIKETTKDGGGMEILVLSYPDVQATFTKMRGIPSIFSLYELVAGGKKVNIGQGQQIVLRSEKDLKKFDHFWGFANVSLINLDLKGHLQLLEKMPFDSRTVWPGQNKLPKGFDPMRVLEDGKNPGLGIRRLHKQGINGNGVNIAIIDQPLVKNHKEYVSNIKHLEEIDVQGVGPQMHGPAVASIAVGKNCGVAPAASLHYYAIPMWKWKNCKPYCDVIDKILRSNEGLKTSEKVRVVSISTGMFSHWNDFALWEETLRKAEQQGVMVITCDKTPIDYGTLARFFGKDPDNPKSYHSSRNEVWTRSLLVPAGNRTTASQEGPGVYTYWTESGISWSAPYLAGLAALAYQVDPEIEPKKIAELWTQTALQTKAGPIINPTAFIKCVQNPNKTSSFSAEAGSKAQNVINAKVDQLNINKATPVDIVRIFGKPLSYQRGRKTYKEGDLPDNYTMIYPERFGVLILNGHVEELRFQMPGYLFRESITVNSTLEEVVKVLGRSTKTIGGEKLRFEKGVFYTAEGNITEPMDGVIYKDIDGRKGFCYYAGADQGIRLLFMNNRVAVLCITKTGHLTKQ